MPLGILGSLPEKLGIQKRWRTTRKAILGVIQVQIEVSRDPILALRLSKERSEDMMLPEILINRNGIAQILIVLECKDSFHLPVLPGPTWNFRDPRRRGH